MSEEEIINKRKVKTFSSCIELVKSMVGTRNGIIAYNTTFRLDLENTCYKASICEELQQENSQLKERIENLEKDKQMLEITIEKLTKTPYVYGVR